MATRLGAVVVAATLAVWSLGTVPVPRAVAAEAGGAGALLQVVATQTEKNRVSTRVTYAGAAKGAVAKRLALRLVYTPLGGRESRKIVTGEQSRSGGYRAAVTIKTPKPISVRVEAKRSGKWVTVAKAGRAYPRTKVTGWDATASKIIRSGQVSDTVAISPAFGRPVYLQMKSGSKWVNVKRYATSGKPTAKVKVVIPSSKWHSAPKTQWRITATKVKGYGSAKSTGIKTVTRSAPNSTIAGWDAGVATYPGIAPGFARSVTVSPAYGRPVYLMASTNGGQNWSEITSANAPNRASGSVFLSTTERTAPSNVLYRVEVRDHKEGKAAHSGTFNVVAEKRDAPNPTTTPTMNPSPTPTVPPTTPPTNPGNVLTGRECNNLDLFQVAFPCSQTARSFVMDQFAAGNTMGCGVTQTCGRTYSPREIEVFGGNGNIIWDAAANAPRSRSEVSMPGLIAQINKERAALGLGALAPMATSHTAHGVTVPGQGGFTQEWANKLVDEWVQTGVWNSRHAGSNVSSLKWNQAVPLTNGKSWACFGVLNHPYIQSLTSEHTVNGWMASTPHKGTLMYPTSTHIAIGGAISETGFSVINAEVCRQI